MDLFREKLGKCSQHDALFDDLNIREHLKMFFIFKGVNSNDVEAKVNKVLHYFKYMEEVNVLVKGIGIISSGHMKYMGSPLFLIEKYGKYMSLNISKEEDGDDKKIVDFINGMDKNVEYIWIILPLDFIIFIKI